MSYSKNNNYGVQIALKSKQTGNSYVGPSQLGYGNLHQNNSNQSNQSKGNTFSLSSQETLLHQNVAIVSKKAQKVLDVCQDKDKKGMLIIYQDCHQSNQRFNIFKSGEYVKIINQQNGKALTVAANSQRNGAPIIQQPVSGLIGQKFRLAYLQNGEYIIHTFCGKALDCCEQKTSNGTPVIQWKFDRKQHQKWFIKS